MRAPIGEILVRHEHLRRRELERLLAEERKHRLVSLLILRAEIETDDATLALSEQSGYPGALERHLEQRDASLAKTFPQALMRNLCVVPLTRTAAGVLVVVARDPSPALADVLANELAQPIELAIAPAIFLERLIQRLAGGAPSAVPPELPAIDRPGPSRHRRSISAILKAPIEAPSMPTVDLPEVTGAQLIQPGLTLDLDDEPAAPTRTPTRPMPNQELVPLLETPSLDDVINSGMEEEDSPPPPPTVSTRPTRPSVAVPILPPEPPVRSTPNIIKRPPTPLPVAPQPIARVITPEPEPPHDPSPGRATYPKLEPPPPSSVFDADTARPKPLGAPKPPTAPPPPKPPEPAPPPPRPRTVTDNWGDFEDSKVGMGVPPPDILDQMSSIGITPPAADVEPPLVEASAIVEPPKRPPTTPPPVPVPKGTGVIPSITRTGPIPTVRAGTQPGSTTRPGTQPGATRAGTQPGDRPSQPRAATNPVVIPPLPPLDRKPGAPPPIPAGNIFKEIEKALSRATADRLLMKHVATKWQALLLVVINGDRAKGSRGHGPRLQAGVENIDLAVASSAILLAAVDPSAPAPDGKDPVAELLGSPATPRVEPVVVDDQVVAVLAAGDTLPGATADELPLLAGALAVAYQRFPK